MKKLKLFALAGVLSFTMFSCSEDDTTAPVIVLNGDASVVLSLNSAAYSDPGATATDDEDGDVTVTSDASSTNPNTNLVGVYTITYTATDAAGNVGTAVRTVTVKNDAEDFAGNFNVHDTVPGALYTYTQNITVHPSINNRIVFSLFGNYANNDEIYATKLGNGTIEIPSQTTSENIGTNYGDSCDVAMHTFAGSMTSGDADQFVITYTDQLLCGGNPITNGTATFTRQ